MSTARDDAQKGLTDARGRDGFEDDEEPATTADLFRLHERAPIFYGLSLDNWELPYTSDDEDDENHQQETGIPVPLADVMDSVQDAERFDKCMALLERGELSHARRLATCMKKSVRLECPEHAGGCGEEHFQPVTCDSRLCPDCAESRMGQLIGEYKEPVSSWENPTMLTLTVENTDEPVRKKDELTDDFGRFRRRVVPVEGGAGAHRWVWKHDRDEPARYKWKQRLCAEGNHDLARHLQKRYVEQGRGIPMKELLRGGFYGVDIKQQSDGSYNVHLHVLCDLAFTPQSAISEVWEDVTGGSPVIDVRRCYGDSQEALAEVVGYAVKPPEFEDVQDSVDVVTELKGSCLVQPFGSLYGNTEVTHRLMCPKCETVPSWWNYKGYVNMKVPRPDIEGDDTRGGNPPP